MPNLKVSPKAPKNNGPALISNNNGKYIFSKMLELLTMLLTYEY